MTGVRLYIYIWYWLELSKCLTGAPFQLRGETITGFPGRTTVSFFFQRDLISHHPSFAQTLSSLPTCFSGCWFQLHFITEILLLPRKKSKVKNNLVFLAMLAEAPQAHYPTRWVLLYENLLRWKHLNTLFAHITIQVQGRLTVLCWEVEGMNWNEITDVRDHLGKSSITSLLLMFVNVSNWTLTYNKLFLAEIILLVK